MSKCIFQINALTALNTLSIHSEMPFLKRRYMHWTTDPNARHTNIVESNKKLYSWILDYELHFSVSVCIFFFGRLFSRAKCHFNGFLNISSLLHMWQKSTHTEHNVNSNPRNTKWKTNKNRTTQGYMRYSMNDYFIIFASS